MHLGEEAPDRVPGLPNLRKHDIKYHLKVFWRRVGGIHIIHKQVEYGTLVLLMCLFVE